MSITYLACTRNLFQTLHPYFQVVDVGGWKRGDGVGQRHARYHQRKQFGVLRIPQSRQARHRNCVPVSESRQTRSSSVRALGARVRTYDTKQINKCWRGQETCASPLQTVPLGKGKPVPSSILLPFSFTASCLCVYILDSKIMSWRVGLVCGEFRDGHDEWTW